MIRDKKVIYTICHLNKDNNTHKLLLIHDNTKLTKRQYAEKQVYEDMIIAKIKD